ncbi:hypothetical protein Efla_005772 [Eimeria flavescens]
MALKHATDVGKLSSALASVPEQAASSPSFCWLHSAYFGFGGFNAYATSKVALLSFANLLRRMSLSTPSKSFIIVLTSWSSAIYAAAFVSAVSRVLQMVGSNAPFLSCGLALCAEDLRGCGSKGVLVTSVHPGYIATKLHQNITDPLVDASCDRSANVEWNQNGLDLDVASALILRAVSRDLEEAWMAVPVGMLQMYVGFYLPNFLHFARRFSAKKECAVTSEYREAIVSQLTGCSPAKEK